MNPNNISLKKAIEDAEQELSTLAESPFSTAAFVSVKEKITQYIADLIFESAKIAKRHSADTVSSSRCSAGFRQSCIEFKKKIVPPSRYHWRHPARRWSIEFLAMTTSNQFSTLSVSVTLCLPCQDIVCRSRDSVSLPLPKACGSIKAVAVKEVEVQGTMTVDKLHCHRHRHPLPDAQDQGRLYLAALSTAFRPLSLSSPALLNFRAKSTYRASTLSRSPAPPPISTMPAQNVRLARCLRPCTRLSVATACFGAGPRCPP